MKQFYLLRAALLLAFSFYLTCPVLAQGLPAGAEIDNSFNDRMNYIFFPLEKDRVPYGLLQDYAMEFTSIENFNGTAALTDSNIVDYAAYWDIYQTLFTARIHSNAGVWKHPVLLDSLWLQERIPGRLALAGLCVGYARFKPDAASNSLVSISNDQIYDQYSNGNWIDPYDTDIAFALTPAVDSYNGRRFEVILPSSTWTSNQSISNIQFDPNDGNGYRAISTNQPVIVHYADTGMKTWIYRVNLVDGRILYSHSRIRIDFAVDPADDVVQSQFTTSGLSSGPQPIIASESFEGQTAKGFITIRYANPNDPQLRRPLIVAEGFDPGHILSPEEKYGMNNIKGFIDEIRDRNPSVLKSILIDQPEYDIIYIDWKKGTDNIFRNAKLLKDVIRLVNQNKVLVNGVKEPNVIIGQSMGGLITRIALKEMENAGENHETRLFISHDAPHQGANVPLAYQQLGRHARNIYISTGPVALGIEFIQLIRGGASPLHALSLANQPASRQMLVNYINDFGNLDNSVHNSFQQQLQNIGYPQTRNVSLSNGSECAQLQDLQPGESLLSFSGKINTRFLGDLAFSGASFFISHLLPASRIFRLGTLPGKNTFQAELQLNSTANGGSNRVYYIDVRYTKKILWLINAHVVLMNKTKYAPSGLLPQDSYPGGNITLVNFQTNTSFQNWIIKYSITASNKPTFNFVSTISSLDIGAGLIPLSDSDFKKVYSSVAPPVAPKYTPFANFIVAHEQNSALNEDHISFSRRNADWAGIEIRDANNTKFDCSALCSDISGPANFCGSESYSISLAPGSSVTWTASGTISISGSTTSSSVTVTSNGSGSGTLTASVSTPCGNAILSKNISTGAPTINALNYYYLDNNGVEQINPIQRYYSVANNVVCVLGTNFNADFSIEGASSVVPEVIYQSDPGAGWGTSGGAGTLSLYSYFTDYGQEIIFRITATSACGSDVFDVGFRSEDCYGQYQYSFSPNPASDELIIEAKTEKITTKAYAGNPLETRKSFNVKLYNDKALVLREADNNGQSKVTLNTQSLANGTYYLHITEGKKTIKKQIIIQH